MRSILARHLLTNVVRAAPLTLTNEIASLQEKYSAAAVACIIRMVPGPGYGALRKAAALKYPADVLNLTAQKDTKLEFLLIKRAVRNKDTWSGDTAFPGGFLELGESDMAAVVRETMEETGMDLSATEHFQWLGRLKFTNFKDKQKVLIPHLFLYLGTDTQASSPSSLDAAAGAAAAASVDHCDTTMSISGLVGGPAMTLEPREVAGVRWIDTEELLRHSADTLGVRSANLIDVFWPQKQATVAEEERYAVSDATVATGSGGRQVAQALARGMKCDTIYFPCFEFPLDSSSSEQQSWVMWGMTFNIVRSLLQVGNGGQEYLNPEAPFFVDNRLFNWYLKLWHRHLPYSGSHSVSGKPLLGLSLLCTLGTYTLPLVVAADIYLALA